MELREYLLLKKGYADQEGNKVYFTDRGLEAHSETDEFWLFLDEGLRCGGTSRGIVCTKDAIGEVLLGCGKKALWQVVLEDIFRWEKEKDKRGIVMKTSDFKFDLPEELIAQEPLEDRASSRLLVVHGKKETLEHKRFRDIKSYLKEGDCLVINNTRVLPARLYGERVGTGAAMEILLLVRKDLDTWEVLVRPGKKAHVGDKISFGGGKLIAEILEVIEGGNRIIRFTYEGVFEAILDELGEMPLPPYITHRLEDKERYQTVYAKHEGSAAAPTAGLHFTPELLKEIEAMGIKIAHVTLHVGLGTFRPVKVEDVLNHEMHSEYYVVEEDQAAMINDARKSGGRVFAVGTTSTRTLESVTDENGIVYPKNGWTQIFIYPGYEFKAVDCLITNFHLPESTLIMLVSALVGKELTMEAYAEAVKARYLFFSFGDACLFLAKE